jgi:hypothetical protein
MKVSRSFPGSQPAPGSAGALLLVRCRDSAQRPRQCAASARRGDSGIACPQRCHVGAGLEFLLGLVTLYPTRPAEQPVRQVTSPVTVDLDQVTESTTCTANPLPVCRASIVPATGVSWDWSSGAMPSSSSVGLGGLALPSQTSIRATPLPADRRRPAGSFPPIAPAACTLLVNNLPVTGPERGPAGRLGPVPAGQHLRHRRGHVVIPDMPPQHPAGHLERGHVPLEKRLLRAGRIVCARPSRRTTAGTRTGGRPPPPHRPARCSLARNRPPPPPGSLACGTNPATLASPHCPDSTLAEHLGRPPAPTEDRAAAQAVRQLGELARAERRTADAIVAAALPSAAIRTHALTPPGSTP